MSHWRRLIVYGLVAGLLLALLLVLGVIVAPSCERPRVEIPE